MRGVIPTPGAGKRAEGAGSIPAPSDDAVSGDELLRALGGEARVYS